MSPRGQQLTAGPHLDIEKLFGLEKWSRHGEQLTAGLIDIEKSFGLEKCSPHGLKLTCAGNT
jgi:hypothetical protein